MTVKELHEKFDRCCKEGIPFEYECLWDGYEAVRHTDLGYCMLISEEDAAMKEAAVRRRPVLRAWSGTTANHCRTTTTTTVWSRTARCTR